MKTIEIYDAVLYAFASFALGAILVLEML